MKIIKKILLVYAAFSLSMNNGINNRNGIKKTASFLAAMFGVFIFLPLNPFVYVFMESGVVAIAAGIYMLLFAIFIYQLLTGYLGVFEYTNEGVLKDYDKIMSNTRLLYSILGWLSIPFSVFMFAFWIGVISYLAW